MKQPMQTFLEILRTNKVLFHKWNYRVPLSNSERQEVQAAADRARYLANRKRYL